VDVYSYICRSETRVCVSLHRLATHTRLGARLTVSWRQAPTFQVRPLMGGLLTLSYNNCLSRRKGAQPGRILVPGIPCRITSIHTSTET
jgi:hypothetical protein